MSPELSIAFKAFIAPLALPMLVLLACWRPWSRRAPQWNRAAGVAVASGVVVGAILLRGWPGLWPGDVTRFVPHAAIAGAIIGLLARSGAAWVVTASVLRLLGSGAMVWILTGPMRRNEWEGAEPLLWIGGLTVLLAGTWMHTERRASLTRNKGTPGQPRPAHGTGRDAVAGLFFVTVGASAVMTLSGSASLGQVAGALAGALAVAWGMLSLRPGERSLRSAVDAGVPALGVLLIGGFFYISDAPPVGAYVRLGLAPAALWIDHLPWIRMRPGWARFLARHGALLLLVADAVRIAAGDGSETEPDAADAASPYDGY